MRAHGNNIKTWKKHVNNYKQSDGNEIGNDGKLGNEIGDDTGRK